MASVVPHEAATSPQAPHTLNKYDNLNFDLTQIVAPVAPPCTGAEAVNVSCSIGVFTLKNTGGGNVDITMDIRGVWQNTGDTDTPAVGIYTAQSADTSIAAIRNTLLSGGSLTNSYSATITSVPEPATLLTFGAGSMLLAAHRRRRAAKAKA